MANPTNPDIASFPIPPPVGALGLVEVRNGIGYLTPSGWEFLQKLWASIQGGGGLIDLVLSLEPNYGLTASVVESLLAQQTGAEQVVAAFLGRLAAMEERLGEILMAAQPWPLARPEKPVARFYGDFPGKPPAGQELFAIPMVGDEHLPAGLGSALASGPGKSFGFVAVAPTGSVTFPLKVNGASVGTMNVASGQTTATFTMANTYNAAAGDLLAFYAPSPQDATLDSPRYTFVGTRS